MNSENNIPNYELLAKYFAGEASFEEIHLIEEWINSGNKHEFNRIRTVWIASDSSSKTFDVNKAFNTVEARIKKSQTKRPLWIIGIAVAAILMLIAIPLIVLRNTNNEEAKTLSFESKNAIAQITLKDGSELTLNSNSKIEYSDDFNNNRKVKLSGEAYFEIEHIDEEHKFVVEAKDLEITVIGTKFNVKAIANSDIVEVSVSEGVVKINQKNNSDFIDLYANEKAIYNTKTFEIVVETAETNTDIFWMTKKIVFNNAQMTEVAATLSTIYNVDINLDLSNSDSLRLNTSFEGNSLEEVLRIIELTLEIKIEKSGNTLTFKDAR
jgi:transmembrane sensor